MRWIKPLRFDSNIPLSDSSVSFFRTQFGKVAKRAEYLGIPYIKQRIAYASGHVATYIYNKHGGSHTVRVEIPGGGKVIVGIVGFVYITGYDGGAIRAYVKTARNKVFNSYSKVPPFANAQLGDVSWTGINGDIVAYDESFFNHFVGIQVGYYFSVYEGAVFYHHGKEIYREAGWYDYRGPRDMDGESFLIRGVCYQRVDDKNIYLMLYQDVYYSDRWIGPSQLRVEGFYLFSSNDAANAAEYKAKTALRARFIERKANGDTVVLKDMELQDRALSIARISPKADECALLLSNNYGEGGGTYFARLAISMKDMTVTEIARSGGDILHWGYNRQGDLKTLSASSGNLSSDYFQLESGSILVNAWPEYGAVYYIKNITGEKYSEYNNCTRVLIFGDIKAEAVVVNGVVTSEITVNEYQPVSGVSILKHLQSFYDDLTAYDDSFKGATVHVDRFKNINIVAPPFNFVRTANGRMINNTEKEFNTHSYDTSWYNQNSSMTHSTAMYPPNAYVI